MIVYSKYMEQARTNSEREKSNPTPSIETAQQFFLDAGLVLNEKGLIELPLTDDQISRLVEWRQHTGLDTGSGFIEMTSPDSFYKKVLLAASLWPQRTEAGITYVLGKGIGAELAIQGVASNRKGRPLSIDVRSHGDFELYATDQVRVDGEDRILPHSQEFLKVFGQQEFYSDAKGLIKGMRGLPPNFLRETAESIQLGGVTFYVPELEILLLDKIQSPEHLDYRNRPSDALLIAQKYELDRDKLYDYTERFVIDWRREYLKPGDEKEYHDEVDQLIAEARRTAI